MFKVIKTRIQQGKWTIKWPDGPAPILPDRFAGQPIISDYCKNESCTQCTEICPVNAITIEKENSSKIIKIDTGKCLFCRKCETVCPKKIINFSQEYRLAAAKREDLIVDLYRQLYPLHL